MHAGIRLLIAVISTAFMFAVVAVPLGAERPYSGLGALVANFNPGGATSSRLHYKVTYVRNGRVAAYEVSANPHATGWKLFRLMLGAALPRDVELIQRYNGYCGIYKSRLLGRVLYGPYAVLYASRTHTTASATVSTAAACRG